MHFSTVLSLALLSTSFVPTSLNGGTSLVLGASAQSVIDHHGHDSRVARRRSRAAAGRSHHVEMMVRQEEKRQVAVSSGLGGISSAGPVVTPGIPQTTSTPATTPRITTTPAVSTTSRADKPVTQGVTSAASSSARVEETDANSDVPNVTGARTTSSSSTRTVLTTSTQTSTSMSSSATSSAATSSSSVMSSASTDAQGSVSFVTAVETVIASRSSSSSIAEDFTSLETVFATATPTGNSSAAAANKSESEDSGGLGTGPIIGISVAGGVVVLAISLFILWKLKQKRFSGYDDDVDGIKWPELNRHGESSTMNLPLPAKPTGGHGFETNALERSRLDIDDDDYDAYSAPVSYANSANDHYAYGKEVYGHDTTPPLPSMGYMDDGYGMTTTAAGDGVTLGRNKSAGAYSLSDDYHHTPLGGTGAFEVDQPEMLQMTGDQYAPNEDGHNANLGRSRSGRLL
ncbi:hypothetical protein NCC49_003517 [Naganishia albida]|nr:hypothetical protein NCC49_003517 [Naganishia albida]